MKDAFLEFCALTTPDGKEVGTRSDGSKKLGNRVSMGADSLGTQQAEDLFVSGEIGMFVDGRWEVTFLREEMEKGSWDVAPLPQYKEYDQEGNVTVHGIRAGHSGSVGLAIAEGSSKKSASWLFLRYVAGEAGQTSQSEAGFCIPNQKDLANSPVFLQTEQDPINSIVFVEAAEHQTPGDWWYLKNNLWIDKWANCLNHEVREGKKTVDYLFETYSESTQKDLYSYTNYKPKA
jgi:multiple sugar transport system substrate-binding protein